MDVLVAEASKNGITRDVAEMIARELQAAGIGAEVREMKDVYIIDEYDAVILGSEIRDGEWLEEARQFADRLASNLVDIPVWMFSTGPIGDHPSNQPVKPGRFANLMREIEAIDHRVFGGDLDEKVITGVVQAPHGNYRDPEAVRIWATDIIATLKELPDTDEADSGTIDS